LAGFTDRLRPSWTNEVLLVVTALRTSTKLLYVEPVSTEIVRGYTKANSASYPQRDGKWVPVKMRCCSAAGK